MFSLQIGIAGACAVCNYDLLHVFPDYHAYNTTNTFAIRGQLEKMTAPLKIIVTSLFNDGFKKKSYWNCLCPLLRYNSISRISHFCSRKKIQKYAPVLFDSPYMAKASTFPNERNNVKLLSSIWQQIWFPGYYFEQWKHTVIFYIVFVLTLSNITKRKAYLVIIWILIWFFLYILFRKECNLTIKKLKHVQKAYICIMLQRQCAPLLSTWKHENILLFFT